jgi:hypothetical protein
VEELQQIVVKLEPLAYKVRGCACGVRVWCVHAAVVWWDVPASPTCGTRPGYGVADKPARSTCLFSPPTARDHPSACCPQGMRLRFTKGVNKAVILGMVDQMLANRDVNIWWLPDELERLIYFNTLTLVGLWLWGGEGEGVPGGGSG